MDPTYISYRSGSNGARVTSIIQLADMDEVIDYMMHRYSKYRAHTTFQNWLASYYRPRIRQIGKAEEDNKLVSASTLIKEAKRMGLI